MSLKRGCSPTDDGRETKNPRTGAQDDQRPTRKACPPPTPQEMIIIVKNKLPTEIVDRVFAYLPCFSEIVELADLLKDKYNIVPHILHAPQWRHCLFECANGLWRKLLQPSLGFINSGEIDLAESAPAARRRILAINGPEYAKDTNDISDTSRQYLAKELDRLSQSPRQDHTALSYKDLIASLKSCATLSALEKEAYQKRIEQCQRRDEEDQDSLIASRTGIMLARMLEYVNAPQRTAHCRSCMTSCKARSCITMMNVIVGNEQEMYWYEVCENRLLDCCRSSPDWIDITTIHDHYARLKARSVTEREYELGAGAIRIGRFILHDRNTNTHAVFMLRNELDRVIRLVYGREHGSSILSSVSANPQVIRAPPLLEYRRVYDVAWLYRECSPGQGPAEKQRVKDVLRMLDINIASLEWLEDVFGLIRGGIVDGQAIWENYVERVEAHAGDARRSNNTRPGGFIGRR